MNSFVARGRALNGRHVLFAFVGFFATVFAVDGFMIYQAVSTFGGIDTPDAYRKGLTYNERIARGAEQSREGWGDKTEVLIAPKRLRVALRDRSGGGVTGKTIVVELERPATTRYDLELSLGETAPGVYEAPLPAAVGEGTWIVDVSAFDMGASSPAYEARRRLWIAP
jgi:nitrogen fixation protein FixH